MRKLFGESWEYSQKEEINSYNLEWKEMKGRMSMETVVRYIDIDNIIHLTWIEK